MDDPVLRERAARTSITAVYADDASAAAAVEALRSAGYPDARLLDANASAARTSSAESGDGTKISKIVWSGLIWGAVGAAAGALVGFIFGSANIGLPGTGDSMALQIASWAMFIHIAGTLWGAYAAIDDEPRLRPRVDGSAIAVEVVASDGVRATALLRAQGAISVTLPRPTTSSS